MAWQIVTKVAAGGARLGGRVAVKGSAKTVKAGGKLATKTANAGRRAGTKAGTKAAEKARNSGRNAAGGRKGGWAKQAVENARKKQRTIDRVRSTDPRQGRGDDERRQNQRSYSSPATSYADATGLGGGEGGGGGLIPASPGGGTQAGGDGEEQGQGRGRRKRRTRRQRKRRRRRLRRRLLILLIAPPGLFLTLPAMFAFGGESPTDPYSIWNGGTQAGTPDLSLLSQRTGIPMEALQAYWSAAMAYPVVDWAILAGIGWRECTHGTSQLAGCNPRGTVNIAGARGPMQFLGSTWRSSATQFQLDVSGPPIPEGQEGQGYASDGNGNGRADPWEWPDATHGAARLLIRNGYAENQRNAVFAYNHAWWYVDQVMAKAQEYRDVAGEIPWLPVNGYTLPLSAKFYEADKEDWLEGHHDYPAADLMVPEGTPVFAAAAGELRRVDEEKCGYGVVIQGDDGLRYVYCHAVRPSTIPTGTHVNVGQLIMYSGNTGNSSGPHLHFGIRNGDTHYCPDPFFVAVYERRPINPWTLPTSGCIT